MSRKHLIIFFSFIITFCTTLLVVRGLMFGVSVNFVYGSVVLLIIFFSLALCFVIFEKRKQNQEIELQTESVRFDSKTIEVATNNFSESNKLGEGGYGQVYKVYDQ